MDKEYTAKSSAFLIRVLSWTVSLIFFVILIVGIIIDNTSESIKLGMTITLPLVIPFFLLGLFLPMFLSTKDTYNEIGLIQKRGKKIKAEIKWENVERISYNKANLITFLMLCPWTCFIYCKEPIRPKKCEKDKPPKTFVAQYTLKEIKKIQEVIPIKIEY